MQTQKSVGQDSTSRLSVLFSPALFVPVSVAAQGGIQFRLNNRWSVLAEAAFPTFYPTNSEYEKIRYWRTSLEFKCRQAVKDIAMKYLAVQVSYLSRDLTDNDQGFYYTKARTFSYSNAIIHSPVLSSAVKLGLEIAAGRRVFADVFFGAGVRFIFNEYETESALVTSIEPKRHDLLTFDNAWIYNHTLMRLHATAGLRVGLRL